MILKFNLRAPRINKQAYEATLVKEAKETIARAIFEYVMTVQLVIPQWTGASIASFRKLADLVDAPLTIQPTLDRPSYVSKRQALGIAHSNADLKLEHGMYSFQFETDLPHLVYNEQFNANVERPPELFAELITPGPYKFRELTKTVVQHVFADFTPPDIRNYVTTRIIRV